MRISIDNSQRNLSEENYTSESWITFQDALAVANNPNATRYEVDTDGWTLWSARNSLVPRTPTPIVNRDVLRTNIAVANSWVEANYLPATWRPFVAALQNAREVYNNPASTQQQVDNAAQSLRNAMNGLIERPQPPEPEITPPSRINLYRLYNPFTNRHIYTTDRNEYEALGALGWNQEGLAWVTPSTGIPVKRLFHSGLDAHHFTLDMNEYNHLVNNGWYSEGTLFYSYEGDARVGKRRLFNPFDLRHLFTADFHEYNVLQKLGWISEGIGFYGMP